MRHTLLPSLALVSSCATFPPLFQDRDLGERGVTCVAVHSGRRTKFYVGSAEVKHARLDEIIAADPLAARLGAHATLYNRLGFGLMLSSGLTFAPSIAALASSRDTRIDAGAVTLLGMELATFIVGLVFSHYAADQEGPIIDRLNEDARSSGKCPPS